MDEIGKEFQDKEIQTAPEIPLKNWETIIFIQRHGRYYNDPPQDVNNLTEEEKVTLGRLTPEGIVEAKEVATQRVEKALTADPENTYFLLINSPAYWYDLEELGQRAAETAGIVAEEIEGALNQRGLSPDHLLNNIAFKGGKSRPEKRIGESQLFQYEDYLAFMHRKYEGQGPKFWDARNSDVDREERERLGAPGVEEDMDEMERQVVWTEREFARKFHKKNPGKRLFIWNVSHGDGLKPYALYRLGVSPEDAIGGYNDGVSIAFSPSGETQVHTNRSSYPVELPEREAIKRKMTEKRLAKDQEVA